MTTIDKRERGTAWYVRDNAGSLFNGGAQIALLMDIREELQQLNNLLGCANAVAIPKLLRAIARNTSRARCRACPRTFESARGLRQHEARAHA